ncbi:MAG: ABC transporter substrate-binding protein [Actinomycetota bacterium]|nr:ABC transporter substrate-binding protein [Actinomycetota bacterium]
MTFPLTGPQAAWGTLIVPVMEISVKDLNDAGGVNGRPLDLVVEDSKGDPQAAVAAMQKLVQVNKVPVVLTIFTNVVTAQAPAAEQLKVPIISTIESPGLTDQSQWNFANSVLLTDTLPLLRDYWKAKGIKRLYAIIPDTSYATFSSPLLTQAAKDLGAEYGESRFKLGETDYRGLVARVKDFNPDAILVTGHGTLDEPLIMRQAREIGIQTPFYSACGCATAKSYRDALGDVGDGLIFAMLRYDKQAAAKLISTYRARLGFDPDYSGIEWYDIVQMVAQAIKTRGYAGDGIRQGLAEIKDFPSVGGGKLTFDQNRQSHQAVALYQLKGTDYTEIKP